MAAAASLLCAWKQRAVFGGGRLSRMGDDRKDTSEGARLRLRAWVSSSAARRPGVPGGRPKLGEYACERMFGFKSENCA